MISAGIRTVVSDRMVKSRIKSQGLLVHDGTIYSPKVPMRAIPAAILLVANASREVADWGVAHLHFHQTRNFRADLEALLGRYFHDNLKQDTSIIGQSNKPHRFVYVAYLSGDRKLLIDPVVNDASSINARLVSNLDVKLTNNPLITQLIVYDDQLKWNASDLKLLEMGAPTVPFSRAEPHIQRLAA